MSSSILATPSRIQQSSDLIRPHLPYSLPLYERLRFSLQSEHAQITSSFDLISTAHASPPKCFALAYIDRSRRPDTECWLYLSSEKPNHCPNDGSRCSECRAAVSSVLSQLAGLPVPVSAHDQGGPHDNKTNNMTAHSANPDILLVGSCHSVPANIINDAGFIMSNMPGLQIPYSKYIFDVAGLPGDGTLPESLRWGLVQERDLPLVISRTEIPRKAATLRMMPSIAVYPSAGDDDDVETPPVAWAFLGMDASLSSLHVEPAFRGQGLAKKMAAKLWRERESGSSPGFGHADVAVDNAESNGVCRSLGGKPTWTVYWLRVDLAKVRQ